MKTLQDSLMYGTYALVIMLMVMLSGCTTTGVNVVQGDGEFRQEVTPRIEVASISFVGWLSLDINLLNAPARAWAASAEAIRYGGTKILQFVGLLPNKSAADIKIDPVVKPAITTATTSTVQTITVGSGKNNSESITTGVRGTVTTGPEMPK